MKIVIGSDHAAFNMKNDIKKYLETKGHDIIDVGTFSEESCDYPKIAYDATNKIINKESELGILICGTGLGMSLAANKVKGIRAAVVSESYSARMSREHNNANVICFGARVIGIETAKDIVDSFLNSKFLADKHLRRVNMISDIEEGKFNL